jgi:hypothetical protein
MLNPLIDPRIIECIKLRDIQALIPLASEIKRYHLENELEDIVTFISQFFDYNLYPNPINTFIVHVFPLISISIDNYFPIPFPIPGKEGYSTIIYFDGMFSRSDNVPSTDIINNTIDLHFTESIYDESAKLTKMYYTLGSGSVLTYMSKFRFIRLVRKWTGRDISFILHI